MGMRIEQVRETAIAIATASGPMTRRALPACLEKAKTMAEGWRPAFTPGATNQLTPLIS
jgi:hypothetical protein